MFEARQSEDDEAIDYWGEDDHEAHQHQLEAGHGPHLDTSDMNHENNFLDNCLTEYFQGLWRSSFLSHLACSSRLRPT